MKRKSGKHYQSSLLIFPRDKEKKEKQKVEGVTENTENKCSYSKIFLLETFWHGTHAKFDR
jgi:hypothetical protein